MEPPFHDRAILAAAKVSGLPPAVIVGPRKRPREARARWAVMLVLRRRGWSHPEIGRTMGGRDHKTVMHGVEQAGHWIQRCPDFAEMVAAVAAA